MLERIELADTLHPAVQMLMDMRGDEKTEQPQDGIVLHCGFNFHNLVNRHEWDNLYMFDDKEEKLPSYGVCDSVEQFLEKFGEQLKKSPHKYAVGFTLVRRADQPESGGWRWHKWGSYIGTHNPQHEYLYDEEGIDEVWTFSIMRKKGS